MTETELTTALKPRPETRLVHARLANAARLVGTYAERIVANPVVAYGLILALQLRVEWNIWRYADLVSGDEASYFLMATSWTHGLKDEFVWSPLYGVFWGTIYGVVHSVYASAILQRLLIVFCLTLMVLGIARALVGPTVGLLIGAWWAVTPNDHDFVYAVHPFGYIPAFLAILVVIKWPDRRGVGAALALLLAGAALDRNELVIALLIVVLASVTYEVHERRHRVRVPLTTLLRAYGVPLVVSIAAITVLFFRSFINGFSNIWAGFKAKSELNFCQGFAYAYQQAHPKAFTGNPWTQCTTLTHHLFDRTYPTSLQAFISMPNAVLQYFWWNLHKLPAGLQVVLFGNTSFAMNPGVFAVPQKHISALLLSLLAVSVLLVGLVVAIRSGWLNLKRASARARWSLVVIGAIGVTDLLVAIYTSPLPEYLYGASLCLMLLVGMAASAILLKLRVMRFVATFALVGTVALLATIPSAYTRSPRPLYTALQNLSVARVQLQTKGSVLVSANETLADSGNDLCFYIAYNNERNCGLGLAWQPLRDGATSVATLLKVLKRAKVSVIYADQGMLADPLLRGLISHSPGDGWRVAAHGPAPDGGWSVIVRENSRVRHR